MKNDYLLPLMKQSGLFRVDEEGRVWTCKKRGGQGTGPWRRAEVVCGNRGRLQVRYRNEKLVYASRFVWYWFYGEIGPYEIDHVDNNVVNNRPGNLQRLNRVENQRKAEDDGLIKRGGPSPARSKSAIEWWSKPGTRERMRESARRAWEKLSPEERTQRALRGGATRRAREPTVD